MIAGDPNVQSVELVAAALGDLCDELVLVGGCATGLLIDAPTATPPRVTYDVDLIAVVAALRHYHALEERFVQRGFSRDVSADAPICRWRIGAIANTLPGLIVFDDLHAQRLERVRERIAAIAAMKTA